MSEQPEQPREKVQRLARSAIADAEPSSWFEVLYAEAKGDPEQVPWARLKPHHALKSWLEANSESGEGKSALTVGCGLGDDAEALARHGFAVTAFDVSPSAIAWCRKRFPNSKVNYVVADLFQPHPDWNQAFDFVLEVRTLQALPLTVRDRAIATVTSFLAASGTLLMVARTRTTEAAPEDPPWPFSEDELAQFQEQGLTEMSRYEFEEGEEEPIPHLQIVFRQLDFNRVWLTNPEEPRQERGKLID